MNEAQRINTAIDDALNYLNSGPDGTADHTRREAVEYMLKRIRRDDGSMAFHWARFYCMTIEASPVTGHSVFTIAIKDIDELRYYRNFDWYSKQ